MAFIIKDKKLIIEEIRYLSLNSRFKELIDTVLKKAVEDKDYTVNSIE